MPARPNTTTSFGCQECQCYLHRSASQVRRALIVAAFRGLVRPGTSPGRWLGAGPMNFAATLQSSG
jgi:hypothetical protein